MSAHDTLGPSAAVRAPRFHWLRVATVRQETSDAISVTFDIPRELLAAYAFRAGQYLTLRTTIDGEEVRRSYSICSGEDDGELRVAIKRVKGGVFSAWAHRVLAPGVLVEAMTPTGRFGIPLAGDSPRVHVAFAAGSGITPVLSILKTVLSREPFSSFFLFYGSRAASEILFRSALEDLKDRYLSRLSVFHVLSREQQDVDVLNGRLNRDKLALLVRRIVGGTPIGQAYICGPAEMITAVETSLADLGVPENRIQVERFTSVLGGRPRAPVPAEASAVPYAIATLILDGRRTEVPVARGESVVDAALRAGLEVPFSCKGGMCSSCRARMLEGEVEMTLNYALEPWETASGFVLTCQSRPITTRIVVDYDRQ